MTSTETDDFSSKEGGNMKIKYNFEMGDDRNIIIIGRITKKEFGREHKYLPDNRVKAAEWEVSPENKEEKIYLECLGIPCCARTDRNGEAIYSYDYMTQYTGTCQFSIYGLSKSSARRKIRDLYRNDEND